MSSTALTNSTHHPRKQNPKVKTGCKTCKKRRIKCDELRPHCLKCTSTGRKCNGYSQTKHAYQTGIISYALESPSNPKRALSPLSKRDNVHPLEFYFHCIGPVLSGRFDTDFWCGIVLQMAHAESAVRNAMIALAHLHQQQTHASRCHTLETSKSTQKFLVHYNKAISCLVSRMTEISYTPETGLVTCLLFACIEFLRRDAQNALVHIRNGLFIVGELVRGRRGCGVGPSSSSSSSSSPSPSPHFLIERTLLPVFTSGLISALLHGVDTDTEFAFLASPLDSTYMHRFTSIHEARHAYCELRNASILLARDMAIQLFQGQEPSAAQLERQTHILTCHGTWFDELRRWENGSGSGTVADEDALAVCALKLGWYTTYTATACVHSARQTCFDVHLDSFKVILHHARRLINDIPSPPHRYSANAVPAAANFTFDTCLVPALYYTALRCRHPATRREAIALLCCDLPREGLWDPVQYRVLAERVVQTEEQEVDGNGWPVEKIRVWSATVTPDATEESGFRTEVLFARDVGAKSKRSGGLGGKEKHSKGMTVGELYVQVPISV